MIRSISIVLFGAAAAFACPGQATAQILTPLNPSAPIVENTIPSITSGPSNAGTTASDGYEIFTTGQSGGNSINIVQNLPDYIGNIAITAPDVYSTASTQLTIGSTLYNTGVVYAGDGSPNGPGTPVNLLTIALSTTINVPDFNLGLFYDYNDFKNTIFTVTLYNADPSSGGMVLSSAVFNPDQASNQNSPPANQFYFGSVTGAAKGDYLVVSGIASDGSNRQVSLGGVTFDAVPEPSTYAMMLIGMGMLAVIGRRRLRN